MLETGILFDMLVMEENNSGLFSFGFIDAIIFDGLGRLVGANRTAGLLCTTPWSKK